MFPIAFLRPQLLNLCCNSSRLLSTLWRRTSKWHFSIISCVGGCLDGRRIGCLVSNSKAAFDKRPRAIIIPCSSRNRQSAAETLQLFQRIDVAVHMSNANMVLSRMLIRELEPVNLRFCLSQPVSVYATISVRRVLLRRHLSAPLR